MVKMSNGYANVFEAMNCSGLAVFEHLMGGLSANATMKEIMAVKRGSSFEM
jgi:hypothetical protein